MAPDIVSCLYNSTKHSDFAFKLGNSVDHAYVTIYAHKAIICEQSEVLAQACDSGQVEVCGASQDLTFRVLILVFQVCASRLAPGYNCVVIKISTDNQ